MRNVEKTFHSFEDFTDLYEVQKTLKFALKPVGKTMDFLKKNEVFKKDEDVAANYQKIKPFLDDLHRRFVAESLSKDRMDVKAFESFAEKYKEFLSDTKKNRKILESAERVLCKTLARNFDSVGEEWKKRYAGKGYRNAEGKEKEIELKSKGYKVLTDASILGVLAIEYPEEAKLFAAFDGFFTYFSGFNQTRENFYKDDGTATAVVTRVVDNLKKFLDNAKTFDRYLGLGSDLQLMESEKQNFEINVYASCILQKDIESYNVVIGELNRRMKILRDQQGKDVKKSEYPLLKTLYGQILGDREKRVLFDAIENNEDAIQRLTQGLSESEKRFEDIRTLMRQLCAGEFHGNLGGIYVTNKAINTISRRWFQDGDGFEKELPQRGKGELSKVAHFVSLQDVKNALDELSRRAERNVDLYKERYQDLIASSDDAFECFLLILRDEFEKAFEGEEIEGGGRFVGWNRSVVELRFLLEEKKNVRDKDVKPAIKVCLDSGLRIFRLAKYFSLFVSDREVERKSALPAETNTSAEFYNAYGAYSDDFDFSKLYDAFRNYLSKKPGDDENKVKLNFENGALLSGWDKNKEKEKLGVLLRSGDSLFLGLLVEGHKSIFDEGIVDKTGDCLEKMVYKFFPDPKRMIPKVSFAESNAVRFGLTDEIRGIKEDYQIFQEEKKADKELWKKKFDKGKLSQLIEYYQHCLATGGYQREFGLKWRRPDQYESLGEFNDDIEAQNYKVTFVGVSKKYIDQKIEDGELYLFEIRNKDSNTKDGKKKTSRKNLHTLYWEALFSELNLKVPRLKLSGGAEVFLRRGKKGELKLKDNGKGGKVLEHKRYAEDKLFFHVPIVLNRGGENASQPRHNDFVRKYLSQNEDACIIGIDRGEKHLLYYSVINQKGEILEQKSLNAIVGADGKGVDYQQKLVECEKRRVLDRQSWEPARRIKDLKSGYVSQAVHAIVELVRKYHAIVVLEDLNMRFKQVRGGVERSVYQQFEHALIDKLGYLVFKDMDDQPEMPGSVFHGYQLAAPFESFEKLGKQSGFLFYTQADYTSVTDPLTGFRKNVYLSSSSKIEELKKVFSKIDIRWDEEKGSYYFTYDQKDFARDKKNPVFSKTWSVYANVPRMKRYRDTSGHWQAELVNPNALLEKLFEVWKIEQPHGDTSESIGAADADGRLHGKRMLDGSEREFWKSLVYIFNLVLQLRNSSSERYEKNDQGEIVSTGESVDFIASPIEPFFQTAFKKDGKEYLAQLGAVADRIVGDEKERIKAEFNGDANGAYNIARRGLMIIRAIRKNPEKPELFISREDWDAFTQNG